VRPEKDLVKIIPFVSKVFTVKRDREKQSTDIEAGYFGHQITD
jgi:DNA sulfur modification protein DndD